jgi:hypothetical protein
VHAHPRDVSPPLDNSDQMTVLINHPALQVFEPAPGALYSIDLAARLLGTSRHAILRCWKHRLISLASNPAIDGWFLDAAALRMLRRIEALRPICGNNLAAAWLILQLQDELERLRAGPHSENERGSTRGRM